LSSRGLVFPSKALEGAPLVYGEAMSAGLPVVAAEGSTVAAQALADQTGTTFDWGDDTSLQEALQYTSDHQAELSQRAKSIYQRRYTPKVWIDGITDTYQRAILAQIAH